MNCADIAIIVGLGCPGNIGGTSSIAQQKQVIITGPDQYTSSSDVDIHYVPCIATLFI